MKFEDCTGYFVPEGREEELKAELTDVIAQYGRLWIARGAPQKVHWIQNLWLNPQGVEVQSVGDAAKQLKAIQRNWAPYSYQLHRRMSLIQEKLPHVSAKPVTFDAALPTAALGAYTLLDQNKLLFSSQCSSPFPNGEFKLVEDKDGPPGRAYLKLWESFALSGERPDSLSKVIDLGSSPGGWTWVLAELDCQKVISIDKAQLDPEIEALPNVEYRRADAFKLKPEEVGEIDWVFSDVICDPARLYELVQVWLEAGVKRFICTLKFKGRADPEIIRKFESIPGSKVIHLFHNKHELTWIRLGP